MRRARGAKKTRKAGSNTAAGRAKSHPPGNRFLKSLFELSSDWYWEQDENLRFTQFTGRGLRAARIDADEWLGKTRWEMSGSIFDAGIWDRHKTVLKARRPFKDFLFKRPNAAGELRYISTSGEPMYNRRGRFVGYRGLARDVTERVQTELRLAIEHGVTRILAQADSITEAAPQVIELMCRTLGWACGARLEPDETGEGLRCTETWGVSLPGIDAFLQATRAQAPSTQSGGLNRRAWVEGEPVWLRDVTKEKTFRRAEYAARAGLGSAFAFPLTLREKVIGVMEFFSRDIHRPDTELLNATRYIGSQIGQFIRRRQAEEVLRQSEEHFRSLSELSYDWYWEQDENLRFTKFSGRGLQRMQIDAASMIGKTRWETPGLLVDPAARAALQAKLHAREPFYDFEYQRMEPNGAFHSIVTSGMPRFDADGRFIGYRGIAKDVTERRRGQQLQSLEHVVNRCLAGADDVATALEAVLRAVGETLGWECGRYFAHDATTDVLRFAAAWSAPNAAVGDLIEKSRGVTYERGVGLIGGVWASGQPLWVPDMAKDGRVTKGIARAEGLHGAFLFPVVAEGKVIGAAIFHSHEVREPDEPLLKTIRVIGSQIGQFIMRQQAEEALRENKERFRAVVDSANEGILVYDRSLRVTSGNAAAERIIGLPLADIIGAAGFTSLLPCVRADGAPLRPEDRPTRNTVRLGKPLTRQILGIKRADGSVTWLSVNTGFLRRTGESDYYGVVSTFGDITEQRQAEAALRESEARFRSLTDLSSDWFWEQDAQFRFTRLEGRHPTGRRSGFESELGKTQREIGAEVDGGWEAHQALLDARQPFRDVIMRRVSPDGKLRYTSVSGEPMFEADGRFVGYRGVGKDITERKLGERATERLGRMYSALSAANEAILRAESAEELYQRLCDAAVSGGKFYSVALFLVDPPSPWVKLAAASGAVTDIWRRARIAIDDKYPEGRGLTGTAFRTQTPQVSNDYLNDERTRPWHKLMDGIGVKANAVLPLIRQGESCGALILYSDETDAFDDEMIKLLVRITENLAVALDNFDRDAERKQAEKRIQYLATHDGLTGLPNRVMFSEMLNLAIQSARRYDRPFAVLFIDLDRFKIINDTLGHEAGDTLLNETAKRLRENLRASDVVARLGGDEFVVLLQEATGEEQVATVARKLLSVIIKPVTILGHECRVTASIGISMFPNDAHDEQSLMKNADVAMYLAKEEGKNNFQFYPKDVKTQSLERLTLETALRQALEHEEFFLEYQAKLDLGTDTITGVEALLRWQHPDRGVVSPAQFIPVAEETGLIVPIGKRVLKAACAQNVAWQRAGLPPVCMAVNLSPRQFVDENLLSDIAAALAESGMAPELLELEITESMVMGNVERAAKQLAAIKQMGVRLAIDDFGTGYSSLAEIKRFPIDTIKVDRSFVREIPHDAEDKAITQAIIALGRSLSLTVVAEGVETEQQQMFLRDHACDEIQGYYFSRPVAPDRFAELLRTHVPRIQYLRKA